MDKKMDKKWTKFWTKNGQKLKLYIQNLMKNYTYTKLLIKKVIKLYNEATLP